MVSAAGPKQRTTGEVGRKRDTREQVGVSKKLRKVGVGQKVNTKGDTEKKRKC